MKRISKSEALARVLPLPYTLVTSLDVNNQPNALGVAWVTRTSFDPWLVLVSIDRRRYSHAGIQHHGEFVVHYPSVAQREGAWVCGTKSGRDGDKIALAGLKLLASLEVKPPTIAGAIVVLECKVVDAVVTGDHTVFVGEVVATRGTPGEPHHLFLADGRRLVALDPAGDPAPPENRPPPGGRRAGAGAAGNGRNGDETREGRFSEFIWSPGD